MRTSPPKRWAERCRDTSSPSRRPCSTSTSLPESATCTRTRLCSRHESTHSLRRGHSIKSRCIVSGEYQERAGTCDRAAGRQRRHVRLPDGGRGTAHDAFCVAHRKGAPCPGCGLPIERLMIRSAARTTARDASRYRCKRHPAGATRATIASNKHGHEAQTEHGITAAGAMIDANRCRLHVPALIFRGTSPAST
jgi:hypothetical protein